MRRLDLDTLNEGIPVISVAVGSFLAEAAKVCLVAQGHQPGVKLKVEGDFTAEFEIHWSGEPDEIIRRSWTDLRDAAEFGAVAIAILAMFELTKYNFAERVTQGFGFDYWLAFFERDEWKYAETKKDAKLEVSGILKSSQHNTLSMRVYKKSQQILTSQAQGEKLFVAVVEFGTPVIKIIKP